MMGSSRVLLIPIAFLTLTLAGAEGAPTIGKATYTYKFADGHPLLADVYRPPDNRVRPVILWLHGGALIFGDRTNIRNAQLVEINKRSPIAPASSPDGQLVTQLQNQKKQLVTDTVSLLGAQLSAEGMDKLHEHLQREKRGMKLIPMNIPAGY